MLEPPQAHPASSFDEAVQRAQAVMARDDERIAPVAFTKLLHHSERRPLAVVLLHGLTNHPGQYVALAPQVFSRGANVYVPRMPYQGYKDRMTTALAALTADELIAAAYDAVDIACGLGERVAVLGISAGGLQCAYLGQYRDDVAISVPVAPDFAILQLPFGASNAIAWLMRHVPNLFLWWDPRIRQAQRPKTAYPRFPTHALAETMCIGNAVVHAARSQPAMAQRITTIVNRADPAVNNEATQEVVTDWRGLRREGIEYVELRNLPENHDIIDPDNPHAAIDIVYPKLIAALGL